MNDEALEIETSAVEAASEDSVEESEKTPCDMPLVDTEGEISDADSEAEVASAQEGDIEDKESDNGETELKAEIARLRAELDGVRGKNAEFLTEIKEFSEIFGASMLSEVPESVWKSAADGTPLAAAYALYEKKIAKQKELAEAVNKKNAAMSAGAIKNATNPGFFSPSEVRAMSPKEVKKNYNLIIESMKKWN